MTAKEIIVIFVLGILVGFGIGSLIAARKSVDYEVKISILKKEIEGIKTISDSLAFVSVLLAKENQDQDSTISHQLRELSKQKASHEKNISSIRSLPADEQIAFLTGWLPQADTTK